MWLYSKLILFVRTLYWRSKNGRTLDEGGYGVFRESRPWTTHVCIISNSGLYRDELDVLDAKRFCRTLQNMGWKDARFVLLF